jgi:DNA-binding SARP family transcriptional activator/tetratricopeptide (TPR) repeat protein
MPQRRGALRFELLGHVRAWQDDVELNLGAPKQRAVLAALLLHANQVVSVERIIEIVWGNPPPKNADSVYTYINGLRRALGDPKSQTLTSASGSPGYRLDIAPDALDLATFDAQLRLARRRHADRDLTGALTAFDAAFALWHGQPLGDTTGSVNDVECHLISERYLAGVDEAAHIVLTLGGPYEDIVARLTKATTEHPTRERTWGLLMRTLNSSGRRADALAAFERVRRYLDEELGISPGEELSRVYETIRREPASARPEAAPGFAVPAQLPPRVFGFTGRAYELDQLDRIVAGDARSSTPSIVTITGTAGVGKTTLAVDWAYRAAAHFPDGCLYVNLNGYGPDQPVSPAAALAGFLRALGVEGPDIPRDLGQRVDAFRSLLARRRLLLIIDNAGAADVVRHLLPGTGRCVALVTSRDALSGIVAQYGATGIELDLLSTDEAIALLCHRIGARVQAEPEAATDLVEQCARLPLALAIAAELARRRRGTSLRQLVTEMTDERHRLDLLETGNDPHTAIRTVLSWSYRHLDRAAARAFRLTGLPTGPDLDTRAIAVLTGTTVREAERVADELLHANLWIEAQPGRYRMHDLLRIYARELAASEDPEADRHRAVRLLLLWYLHSAAAAESHLTATRRRIALERYPGTVPPLTFAGSPEAMGWFETERRNLVAASRQADEDGLPTIAWQLPASLGIFFYIRKYWTDWLSTHETALAAAEREQHQEGTARVATSLGNAYYDLQDYTNAIDYHSKALRIRQTLHDLGGQAISLMNTAEAHRGLAHFEEATQLFHEALTAFRETGDQYGEAMTLSNLGNLHYEAGNWTQALADGSAALALRRELNDPHGLSFTLNCLGDVYRKLHRFDEAIDALTEARQIRHQYQDRYNEAVTLCSLAETMTDRGRPEQAQAFWQEARALLTEVDNAQAAIIARRIERGGGPPPADEQ